MTDFIARPVSEWALRRRRLVYGVGVNDADYIISIQDENKRLITCPYYSRWSEMLKRCYSDKYQKKKPTYIGCEVADEWKRFSSFKSWMEKQDWKGKYLDKDILVPGNKVYSEHTCTFVSRELNSLLSHERSSCGSLPLGVTFSKKKKKFVVRCNIGSRRVYLGEYSGYAEASAVYRKAKHDAIVMAAEQNERLREPLLARAIIELNGGLYD